MTINPLLVLSLIVTGAMALWGLLDSVGLQAAAGFLVGVLFTSRAWFIMLTASLLLLISLWLMVSPVGKIKLGQDDEEPEFSTGSWISMLFAAGMGVGLLYWGTAEPLSHFALHKNAKAIIAQPRYPASSPTSTGVSMPGRSMRSPLW